ncbi:uncharacterized protein M421DRAFT_94929 [Didymella exigua CBS 183.55]|uniref:Uncharacterized protein n=1 Tax=Didymella exigua CBS 183.55 TaxID=1150837 RepID=A0A6A5RCJ9_9PLEO|nr:uncharacterized protein M421DRAFT_94929 [Didymella exigua CBS 183.55]KAF1925109.1 hypothetical protein M421DRAFT_94929 [Didymella exigua CBS 183.55]
MDPAPTAPLPAAAMFLVELTATRQEPQPGAARLAGRSRQGYQRLATQSNLHDKPLVDSFKAEKNSNLPLQRDGFAAADAPFNSPPKLYAPGYRLPDVAALQSLRYGQFATLNAQISSAPFSNGQSSEVGVVTAEKASAGNWRLVMDSASTWAESCWNGTVVHSQLPVRPKLADLNQGRWSPGLPLYLVNFRIC